MGGQPQKKRRKLAASKAKISLKQALFAKSRKIATKNMPGKRNGERRE